jgi:hypothetical protein
LGARFDVTKIINSQGNLDVAAYQEYSEPYMTAGTIVAYIFYFIMYSASKSTLWMGLMRSQLCRM